MPRAMCVTAEQYSRSRIPEILKNKFWPNEPWSHDDSQVVADSYSKWLELLRLVNLKDDSVVWTGGGVSAFDFTSLAELAYLQDRTLYDKLVEEFATPKNILDEPHSLLQAVSSEKDDKKRGELFENFIACCFGRLGFSSRQRAGAREAASKLSFASNRGGGDVALLSHFPVRTLDKEFVGSGLACEAKSTEGQVGSKAVGQARNLAVKMREAFQGYFVQPIVVSRSAFGFDQSGRDLSPPEVVLLPANTLLEACKLQKERLEEGNSLLVPAYFHAVVEEHVKKERLEPTVDEFISSLAAKLESEKKWKLTEPRVSP